eukprot:TRINITY_DN4178_c0_g1_i2.p3 TRINITY_DN4178_c0_g1~~TRINITY_DN4178_c0_g1_i2.p3  ORF type:complete len:111 (+),score=5.26 TRINITY_DN4178_c0_g1_i2:36-335(+)
MEFIFKFQINCFSQAISYKKQASCTGSWLAYPNMSKDHLLLVALPSGLSGRTHAPVVSSHGYSQLEPFQQCSLAYMACTLQKFQTKKFTFTRKLMRCHW